MEELTNAGLQNIQFCQLDIDNVESIARCAAFIKEKHGGLDILINNAGILYPVCIYSHIRLKCFYFQIFFYLKI